MDRIVLGEHANNSLGVGLYVSKPGSNVMDPASSTSANLMFNSNEGSSLHIIQSGTFKITCERKELTVPSLGSSVSTNFKATQRIGYSVDGIRSKIQNELQTGMIQIPLASPLPNGEIPEVALRFAVGNSSGHFHPWYANVTLSGSGMNWDEYTYANSTQIVHMDSPWIRMKWGGIGNESYSGAHLQHTKKNFMKLLDDGILTLSQLGSLTGAGSAATREQIEERLDSHEKQIKEFSTIKGNAQGAVGLIQYCNSTSLTVDAFMSPTHAGQKGYPRGSHGIDSHTDWENWNFPLENEGIIHASYGNYVDYFGAVSMPPLYYSYLGEVGDPGYGSELNYIEYHHDMHLAQAFNEDDGVRAEPLGTRAFRTVLTGNHDGATGGGFLYSSYQGEVHQHPDYGLDYNGFNFDMYAPIYGPEMYAVARIPFEHLPMVDTFLSPMEQLVETRKNPYFAYGADFLNNDDDAFVNDIRRETSGPTSTWGSQWRWRRSLQTLGRGYGRMTKDDGNQDMYGWKAHPTQFFVNPYSNNQVTFGHINYGPYDLSPAILGGAGTGETDAWDTFYCSYAVYSVGGEAAAYSAQAPTTVVVDMRSKDFGGHLQATGKYRNDPVYDNINQSLGDLRYYNLSFPEDFVGTIGDEATDPFYNARDLNDPQKRIYGNINVIFKIPYLNTDGGTDYVQVGSASMSYPEVTAGQLTYEGATGIPDPAITFDLSDKYFIFENNEAMTLTIENSGYVMGGGGSGGRGNRLGSLKEVGQAYMGGGGGAGNGSGGFEDAAFGVLSISGSHNGVGIGGSGFGQEEGFSGNFDNITDERQRGQNGESLISTSYMRRARPYAALIASMPTGGSAATLLSQVGPSFGLSEPVAGGDGGDVFKILTGTVLPTVEVINKDNAGANINATNRYNGAVLVSGGGGGGGGVGKAPGSGGTADPSHAVGASGAMPGHNANEQQGSPSSTTFSGSSVLTQEVGGLAGYLVSGETGPYRGPITIRNESDREVRGRSPSLSEYVAPGTSTRGYVTGFEVLKGETKAYEAE